MKTIKLNNKKPIPFGEYETVRSATDLATKKFMKPLEPKHSIRGDGFLNYLAKAWENHYSVIVNPTDIWYIVVSELSQEVNKNPKQYEKLFTTTPGEKQLILVLTDDVTKIDPNAVVETLKRCIPINIDPFLATFSTDTIMTRHCLNVAFCEMASPYYSYGTFLCGFPNIEIGGTGDDWANLAHNLQVIRQYFTGRQEAYLRRCFARVQDIIAYTHTTDYDATTFFNKMVKLEKCGSGHQFDMSGWILDFLDRKDFTQPLQLEGLHTQISKMDYFNMETQRTFTMQAGICFFTVREDGFMVPEYNSWRVETTKPNPPAKRNLANNDLVDSMTLTSTPVVPNIRKLQTIWTSEEKDDITRRTAKKTLNTLYGKIGKEAK